MSLTQTPLFRRLLELTPFSEQELVVLIATAPARYKDHLIRKRHGGTRLISQPTKELKFLQRLVVKRELDYLPIHVAATAYRPGKSIRDHATPHASAKYLLKLDFKDFFLSLEEGALQHRLEVDTSYSKAERWLLCNLLCRQPKGTKMPKPKFKDRSEIVEISLEVVTDPSRLSEPEFRKMRSGRKGTDDWESGPLPKHDGDPRPLNEIFR